MAEAGPGLEEELLDFCHRHLARIKCPRSIDFEENMPRTPTGKLLKRLLQERYKPGGAKSQAAPAGG
jgi:acyl-CoA synthetase (AMP-forming)/AMP-acid ligase II